MEKRISGGLRATFILHAIVGLIFGLVLLLIPNLWANLANWPMPDVMPYRLMGAAILGFTSSSLLALRETDWEKVKIVVRMEIVWTVLGTLANLYGLLFAGMPVAGWLNVVVLGIFAILFSVFYVR